MGSWSLTLNCEQSKTFSQRQKKGNIEDTLGIPHNQIEGYYPNVCHFPESGYSNKVIFI